MPKGGLRSTSFKPGKSGNPSGRPKLPEAIEARRIIADVKVAARELSVDAMDTLKQAMKDPNAPWPVKVSAANAIRLYVASDGRVFAFSLRTRHPPPFSFHFLKPARPPPATPILRSQ